MTDKTPLGADKIKEAAERYAVQNYPILADGQISRKKETERNKTYANSFIAGATSEAAREYWEGQGWVRVGDGLPQKGERVFVCTDNWVCACCYINIHDEWKLAYDSSLFHGNITHWRPLPAPPNQ